MINAADLVAAHNASADQKQEQLADEDAVMGQVQGAQVRPARPELVLKYGQYYIIDRTK